MSGLEIVAITGIFAMSSFLNIVSGFGFALVAAPLMAVFMGPKAAIVYITAASCVLRYVMLWKTRKDFSWKIVAMTGIGSIIGIIPGSYLLGIMSGAAINILLGVALLVAVWLMVRQIYIPVHNLSIGRFGAGFFCGFFTATTSVGGPPLALWFVNEGMEKVPMRANMSWTYAFSTLFTLVGSYYAGTINEMGSWYNLLYALPGLAIGYYLGNKCFLRINQTAFRKVVMGIILLGGLTSLTRGIIG